MIQDLPDEIVLKFLLKLSIGQIREYCQTHPEVYKVCQNDYFWRLLVKRDFGVQQLKNADSWKTLYQILSMYIYSATIVMISSEQDVNPYESRSINTQNFMSFDNAFEWILNEMQEIDFDLNFDPSQIPGLNSLSRDFRELVIDETYHFIKQDLDPLDQQEFDLYTQMLINYIKTLLSSGEFISSAGIPLIYFSIIKTRIHV